MRKISWIVSSCHRLFQSKLHPAVVIPALTEIGFVLIIAVYVRVGYLLQQLRKQTHQEIQSVAVG